MWFFCGGVRAGQELGSDPACSTKYGRALSGPVRISLAEPMLAAGGGRLGGGEGRRESRGGACGAQGVPRLET